MISILLASLPGNACANSEAYAAPSEYSQSPARPLLTLWTPIPNRSPLGVLAMCIMEP